MQEPSSKKLSALLVELRRQGVKEAVFAEANGALLSVEFFDPKYAAELHTARIMQEAMSNATQAIDELARLRLAVANAKTAEEREHFENALAKAEAESIVYQSS